MSKLGDALGLELETDRVEVAVGPYSADILARDSAGDYVVIENQLNKTDHDHLGKSITYASVLGAQGGGPSSGSHRSSPTNTARHSTGSR